MNKRNKLYVLLLTGSIGFFTNPNSYCEIHAQEKNTEIIRQAEENKVVFRFEKEDISDSGVNELPLFTVREKKLKSGLIDAVREKNFWNKGEYSCGDNFLIFYSDEFKYYDQVGAFRFENAETNYNVTFLEGEACIDRIGQILEQLGFSEEEFTFYYYSISSENLKQREEKYIEEKLLEKEDKKSIWTTEDDAYIIYGYQKIEGFPVLHQHMSAENSIIPDMPVYAPIQAIYSTRGIEYLRIADVYEADYLEQSENVISLETAMEIVRKKFSDMLNDSVYEIENARLCEKVFFNQKQKLEMQPVWCFEVVENDKNRTVTVIHALTGEEE